MENNNVETTKTEEQIREEVKEELKKEEEIKDQVKKELAEQQNYNKGRIKKVIRVIWNIVMTLIFLFVAFEIIIGVLNMQRLNEDKEPVWYFDSKVEVIDDKKETKYNMGLYVIDKVEDSNGTKLMLKPFFIK